MSSNPNMMYPRIITFVNTFSYYKLIDSKCHLEKIDYIFADGILQVLLHNIFHKNKINRASFDFSSLANDFFVYAVKNNLRVALAGATDSEIQNAVNNLKTKYTSLDISFYRNGYFQDETDKYNFMRLLKDECIDVVILGMGTPRQEELAVFLKDNGINACVFTCGGFLSQTAKRLDYYTNITKKAHFRWLQRFFEYKHIRKRLLCDYPKNIIRYVHEHILLFFNG